MKKPNHIFVIRLSAMGDVAMTVPVLRVLLQTYPQLKITVVSKTPFKPLFSGLDRCDFLEADVRGKHKGFGIFKLAKQARALGIEAVADLHNVIRSKAITNYLGYKGIKRATINKGRSEKKALVAAKGKQLHQLKSTHQRYADVFEELGYPIDLKDYITPKPLALQQKHHLLIGTQPKKLIGIAPFAAYKSKMYPLEMMEEVISELGASNKYQILLFGGGASEIEQLETIAAKHKNVINVAGTLTFSEELVLLSNLDLMVAMDSSNGHLAAMFGIPVITLWGVTHPYAGFKPFSQPNANQLVSNRELYPLIPTSIYGNKFPAAYENVMESIPTELVLEKIYQTA